MTGFSSRTMGSFFTRMKAGGGGVGGGGDKIVEFKSSSMSGNLSQPASFRDEDLHMYKVDAEPHATLFKQHFAQSLSARSNMLPVLDDHQPVRWQVQLSTAFGLRGDVSTSETEPHFCPYLYASECWRLNSVRRRRACDQPESRRSTAAGTKVQHECTREVMKDEERLTMIPLWLGSRPPLPPGRRREQPTVPYSGT